MRKNSFDALRLLLFASLALALLCPLASAYIGCGPPGTKVDCNWLSGQYCEFGVGCGTIDYPEECYQMESKGHCRILYSPNDCTCSCGTAANACRFSTAAGCASHQNPGGVCDSANGGCQSSGAYCRFDKWTPFTCANKQPGVNSLDCSAITEHAVCTAVGCNWNAGCEPDGATCTGNNECCSGKCKVSNSGGGETGSGNSNVAGPLGKPGVLFNPAPEIKFDLINPTQGVCVSCWPNGYGSCTYESDCCAGLMCDAGICRSCRSLGSGSCSGFPGKGDCCAGSVCDAAGTCVACYAKKTECTAGAQCCSGFCEGTPQKCCMKDTSAGACSDSTDCCSGYTCNPVNSKCELPKPPKPATPQITPAQVQPTGTASCIANCAGNDHRWKKDAAVGGWAAGAPLPYDCAARGCADGEKIYLQTRNCISATCAESDWSTHSMVVAPPPPMPGSSNYLQYVVYALLLAAGLLALAYMVSKIFSLPHWVPIIGDELVQVLATGAVALCLVGITYAINNYLTAGLTAGTGNMALVQDNSNQIYQAAYTTLGGLGVESVLAQLQASNNQLASEASKGIYCSMLGVGFTLVNCSPLNAFRGTLTSAAFTTVVGITDVYAQQFLLTLAATFSFTLIIPAGLFFRCFKPTRGAGGALIAIGFGFYTAYPLVIVATANLLVTQSAPLALPNPAVSVPSSITCDPYETDVAKSRDQFYKYAESLSDASVSDSLTYLVLVKVIFLSILNLIITLGFIGSLAKVLGSDIDLSGLARIG